MTTSTTPPFPANVRNLMVQARQLRAQGALWEAAALYRRVDEIDPNLRGQLFAALCLRDAGDKDAALLALEAYCARAPYDIDGWTSLALLHKRDGDCAAALAPLTRALAIKEDPTLYNTLIGCLYRLGQHDAAIEAGLHNLQLKNELSLTAFAALPTQPQLNGARKSFDPEDRSRNVLSFSLWGQDPAYVTGAIINAQISQHIYARWTARFYCAPDVPADAIHALKAYGAQVVMMNRPEQQNYRSMWRFLVSDDPRVNVFACRDTDARLNPKELWAVSDWLQSGQPFHIMRDHIYHHELMLAGMWGGMAGVLPPLRPMIENANRHFHSKFGDQAFLAERIWPLVREQARIHDSHYTTLGSIPFPQGYDLPGQLHVGGGSKSVPHWSHYVQMPRPEPTPATSENQEDIPNFLRTLRR